MFEIGRIRFRPLSEEDLNLLQRWESNFKVTLYSRAQPLGFKNEKDIQREFEEYMENKDKDAKFIIEKREDDKKVGTASYKDRSKKIKNASLGTYIGEKDEWNKGLGHEITAGLCEILFFHKNFDRLNAWSASFNKRAQSVLEKVGFKKTGRARKSGYLLGKRIDWLMFDLLREEYMKDREKILEKIFDEKKEEYIKNYCQI